MTNDNKTLTYDCGTKNGEVGWIGCLMSVNNIYIKMVQESTASNYLS